MFYDPAFSDTDYDNKDFLNRLILSLIQHCSGVWFWLRPGPNYFPAQTIHVHNSPLRNFRKNIGWYTLLLLMTLITIILVKYLINVFSFYIAHTLNITFDTSFIWDHIHVQVITFFVFLVFVKFDKKFPFKLTSMFKWYWWYSSLNVEKTGYDPSI